MRRLRELDPVLQTNLTTGNYSVRETSYLGLVAGDLIQLTYAGGSYRFGLVVASRRTSNGMFLSTQNNRLLNVVLLDTISEAMFSMMVNNLYRNQSACNYHNKRIIGAFLGKDNFRTFNISKVTDILKIEIQR